MDQFFHIRMLVSMIVSLSLAHLLKGVVKIVEHPKRVKIYWVHLLWVAYLFFYIIDFWWWELKLKTIPVWNFRYYFFVIIYIAVFYFTCSLIFPDDLKDYAGYKEYYYSRRKWFFSFMACIFLLDVGDTSLKGGDYFQSLGPEYIFRIGFHVLLCLLAIRIRKEWFHAAMVIIFLLYNISWILRKYYFEV